MAPTPGDLSAPGSASYSSDTLTVGDGTWVFDKNTFLLPNLQGVNFETMRYNGMGNRFSTFVGYHSIIMAHAVMAALVFLLIVPLSVMTIRFYDRNRSRAIGYHGQLQVLASLMLLVIFILGFFAVGPKRNLTNPHHGIGVAIFVLFVLQLVGGRLVLHITKSRSLRRMIHQWSGRAIGLLGIVQVPLGLTLYGSPKYLFILYALWMSFLVLLYFILSYRHAGHRDVYLTRGTRSEGGGTDFTETEYISDHKPEKSSNLKWLGPLAAGAGLWALLRNGKKKQNRERSRSRSRSRSPSSYRTNPEVLSSRGYSERFYDDKYSEPPQRKSSGGGFMKTLATVAAAVGAGGLAANFMKKRNNREEEYSAVSTDTPRRNRSGRGQRSDYGSEYTDDYTATQTSLLPPSANPATTYTTRTTGDTGRPTTPRSSYPSRRDHDESDYSSYVSPSHRRPAENSGGGGGGGVAKGILGGLGMGWIAKKLADRRNKKQEERLREEDDMRSGTNVSRFTGDGYPSPTRDSRRPPPVRRQTGYGAPYGTDTALSEMTESSIDHPPRVGARSDNIQPVPMPLRPPRSSGPPVSEPVSMPSMPADPHGVLHSGAEGSLVSTDASAPQRRPSERRRKAGERAAAAAAARASSLAANEGRKRPGDGDRDRDRYASPNSQPVSVKVKVHDDRDRNVTLRRLTEEETMAARGRRDSESSISGIDSPSNGRGYRRAASPRTAERQAEQRVEQEDQLAPLSPPKPAFAKGRRGKDSAYYSGAAGPAGSTAAHGQTVSSLGSQGTHGTWSGMSGPPPSEGDKASESAAADNRRRRRMERRRGSSAARPSGLDMFE
ncbi:Cytochrome b561 ferric reductase transmembrane [Cordyceps militaris]|uniref:Cytochrome b561 ferric reductase transmembrane n=1 Tax=Cordyceps militaris TaxID=73501 RepID=A0A2H4SK80_CORMI|nr:Cytochrome b561 ferric reductase transmembrane [Cordyceps militaris]